MLDFENSDYVTKWVEDRIPHVDRLDGPCYAIGVYGRSGGFVAGVVYHSYRPEYGTIQLSMAADSPMWATRENIAGLLWYPFEYLGCYKVYTVTPTFNEMALKVNANIGFGHKTVLAHEFGRKKHAVIMSMYLPDYERKYKEMTKNGQIDTLATTRT